MNKGKQQRLVLEFTKMTGAGNDFIVIDNRFYHFTDQELSKLAAQLCHRRLGVGADGLLAFATPTEPTCHFRMRYFNADGSRGTMCGNGARCLVRFGQAVGIQDEEMNFETDAGLYRALVSAVGEAPVRLYVPPFQHFMPDTPSANGQPEAWGAVHYIWTGTEHLVCFVEDTEAVPVAQWGRHLRHDSTRSPVGANVNFVQVVEASSGRGEATLRVRTFERGVEAETLACGTGTLASALVARLLGQITTDVVNVEVPGGVLQVGFCMEDQAVTDLYLEGPAEVVFRGTLEV